MIGLTTPLPWMIDQECGQTDPEIFFPDVGDSANEAKAICRRCPVRTTCAAYALEHRIQHGVWGGLSVKERRALRKRLAG